MRCIYYNSRRLCVLYKIPEMNCLQFLPSFPPRVSPLLDFECYCLLLFRCYRPALRATNPNAISSRSALLGSRVLRLTGILIGGIFSFPGSSLLTFLTRIVLPFIGLRFLDCAAGWGIGFEAGISSSVSSKTTVARPPIPSPRRIEGVRLRGARLGAQDDIHVVSREGFCMFFVMGDNGA